MSSDLRVCRLTWYSANYQGKQFLLYLLVKNCPEHGERDVKEKHPKHHLCLSNQSFLQKIKINKRNWFKKRRGKKKKRGFQIAIHITAIDKDPSCNVYPHIQLCIL